MIMLYYQKYRDAFSLIQYWFAILVNRDVLALTYRFTWEHYKIAVVSLALSNPVAVSQMTSIVP